MTPPAEHDSRVAQVWRASGVTAMHSDDAYPPALELCASCGTPINPATGECRCSE